MEEKEITAGEETMAHQLYYWRARKSEIYPRATDKLLGESLAAAQVC